MKTKFYKYYLISSIVLLGISGCYLMPRFSGRIIKESDEKLVLKIPGKNWKFVFDYDSVNYISPYDHFHNQGEFANVMAVIEPDWTFTFIFGKHDRRNNIDSWISKFEYGNFEEVRKQPIGYIYNIKGEVYTAQSLIDQIYPLDINQMSKYIVFFHDGVGVDIKISKTRYTPTDEETFKKLISSIKIIED